MGFCVAGSRFFKLGLLLLVGDGPIRQLLYEKDFDGFLEVGHRSVVIALTYSLCELGRGGGGKTPASIIREDEALPLLNYTLAFALQLRKSTENLSKCSRVVRLLLSPTWLLFEGMTGLPC
jgi:hypothetical protein